MILDSGNRREFDTGAVRDMQEGKGRCDLLPLDIVAKMLPVPDRSIIYSICTFQETGDFICLIDAAIKYVSIFHKNDTSTAMLELAKHFEEGCKKYEENNWKKGIPASAYIDSAVRHFLKFKRGDTDERHDRAFLWNLICCAWTCKNIPELNCYAKKEGSENENR